MSAWKKWTIRILGGLVLLIVAAVGTIYALSERTIGRKYAVRTVPITLPTDSASLARGAHFLEISCRGCHQQDLRGAVMFDEPGIARLVAPNLLERIANYSDAELAGFLRYGVHKDSTSSFVMPPRGYYHLSDADLGSIIASLRSQPKQPPKELPENAYRPLGRFGVVMGQFKPVVAEIDTTAVRVGDDSLHRTTRQGEYLARVICTECHGPKLTGDPAQPSPSLVGALAYDLPQFTKLLRTGTPREATTKLTLMAEVANAVFKHLSDEEIAALHAYLSTLPASGVVVSHR